jgi:hypothetical protein
MASPLTAATCIFSSTHTSIHHTHALTHTHTRPLHPQEVVSFMDRDWFDTGAKGRLKAAYAADS